MDRSKEWQDRLNSSIGDALDPDQNKGEIITIDQVNDSVNSNPPEYGTASQIESTVPVSDEMDVDLEALFRSEQDDGISLFSDDVNRYREAMYPKTKSDRLGSIMDLAISKGLSESIKSRQQSLTMSEEAAMRSEIAMQESTKSVNNIVDKLASMEIDEDMASEALRALYSKDQEYSKYTAEIAAANNLVELGRKNPMWNNFALEDTSLFEKKVEDMKRDLIIRSFIDQEVVNNNSVSWWESGEEFYDDSKELIASIFLDEAFTSLIDVVGGGKATALRLKSEEIRNLPVEDVPKALEEFKSYLLDESSVYLEDNETAAENLRVAFGTEWERNNSAGLDAFDAAITLLTMGSLTGSGSVRSSLKKTGNVDKVADDASKALATGDVEDTVYDSLADVVQDSMPVKVGDGTSTYINHSIKNNLNEIDAVLEEAKYTSNPSRLDPEELEAATSKTISNLRLNNDVVNVGVGYNDKTSVYEATLLVGKVDGTGYSSRKSAASSLKKTGLDGEIIETEDGFKAKVVMPVKESFSDKGFVDFKPHHPVKTFFQGPKAFVDSFIGKMGTSSAFNEGRITGVLKDVYNKNFSKLSTRSKSELSEIMDEGLNQEKWFTSEDLQSMYRTNTGKELPADVEQAYHAMVKMSDYTWFIQNRAIYQDKVSKGFLQVSLDMLDEPVTAKVLSDATDIKRNITNHTIYHPDTGNVVKATPEVVEDIVKKGYMVVRPEDATWTGELFGSPASYIATKRKGLKISQLDPLGQLGYVQGGRREYTSNFFIGQKNHMTGADGSKYLGSPKVMRTADTVADANKFVNETNKSFELMRKFRDQSEEVNNSKVLSKSEKSKMLAELKEELNDSLIDVSRRSYDDLVDMINKERWDINTPVQVKRNRGDFPDDVDTLEAIKLYDPDNNHTRVGAKRNNRLSARGDTPLLDVNGDQAITLNFMSALRESADQAVKFGAYSEFKASAINRFSTTFSKYIENNEKLTPYEMVVKGQPLESLAKSIDPKDRQIHRALKAHQFYIKSMLRVRTKWDEAVQNALNSVAQKIEGRGKLGRKMAVSIYDSGNPVEKIRSINYDLNLGMFNPSQYILQAQSMFAASALSPAHGMMAFKEAVPLRYALIVNDDNTVAHISKSIRDGVELDGVSDIQKSAAQFKRLGLHDFGSNIAMMDAQSSIGITSNPLMDKAIRVREQGRMFFQEGERMGRLIAYGIAKRKYAEQFKTNVFSKKADIWIREETDRLLLSPNADNNQMFTKGVLSLPTQFWSYMGKMADVFLTGANGRYTPKERAMLASSQVLLYGAGGLPMLEYMLNTVETESGEKMDPDTAKFLHNGILDGMVYVMSDGEMSTNISDSAGFAGWSKMMYDNLSDNTLAHVLGGASGGNISSAGSRFMATARLNGMWTNPTPQAVTEASFAGLVSLVSSMDKASQAYMAFNSGVWYDKYGRKMFKISKAEALGSLFGMPPQGLSDVYNIASDRKGARDKYINEVTTTLQGLHEKYSRAETDEEREHIESLINTLASVSSQTGYWGDVSNRFFSFQKSDDFLDSQMQQMQLDAAAGKAGVNLNFFTKEQREEYREGR